MHSWAKWTAKTVLVTTGFAAAGGGLAGAAFAGTGTSAGNISVLGGNQVNVPVSIPIDICGNAAALLGIAAAGCQGGAEVTGAASGVTGPATHGLSAGDLSAGNGSVASGSIVKIPVAVAANACGNAVGNATAQCQGGVSVPLGGGLLGGSVAGGSVAGGSVAGGSGGVPRQAGLSAGNVSVGSGNQVQIPVTVPANICGNAVAILGDSSAGCTGGASLGARHEEGANGKSVLSATQLAGLGTLPGAASLPTLAGLSSLPELQGLTGGGALLPASTLSALQGNVAGGGMSSDSFVTLAVGALLAGAAALKLAGRRAGARKVSAGEVSA
jgi:ChpA-C